MLKNMEGNMLMLSKKYYVKIAKIFNDNFTDSGTVNDFITMLDEDNPRFDIERFKIAVYTGAKK